MTGERLYNLYCKAMSTLPYSSTKGEALPAWDFIDEDLQAAWNEFAKLVKGRSK